MKKAIAMFVLLLAGAGFTAVAQTTAINYQGSLNTSGTPANGNHDFEFALFDSLAGGTQLGSALTRSGVAVANGVFAVSLDFGNQFPGANRFLEVRVRTSGGGAFTPLSPRQAIDSSPYAINAAQLGGVAASQYVVSGAPIINAATQFNIGGSRILGVQGVNTFVGHNSGVVGTGTFNSFFGHSAGQNSSGNFNNFFGVGAGQVNTGPHNNFFGVSAGGNNTTGRDNAFFGHSSGVLNTTGFGNSFYGHRTGAANTVGNDNSFFGHTSGENSTGSNNAFFGSRAGNANTSGNSNTFFGNAAGASNTTASFNTFVGNKAGELNIVGTNNTFFGSHAGERTTSSLNAFFGSSAGRNSTGEQNSFFGALAGSVNTTGSDNSFFGESSGRANTTGINNSFFGSSAGDSNTTANDNSFFGAFSGQANTTGLGNAFFGKDSGLSNTTGSSNSFFGTGAGEDNVNGFGNSFFGNRAGSANTTAGNNSFFGRAAGIVNTTGGDNSFFGANSGVHNITGASNSFFGHNSGFDNTIGTGNSAFGATAGDNNSTGTLNSFFGFNAGDGSVIGNQNSYFGANTNSFDGLTNATAIGSHAFVSQSNSLILGSINGTNGAVANTNVGIGTTAPINRLTIGQPETPVLTGLVGVFNPGGAFIVARDTTSDIEGFFGADENGALFGSLTNSIVRIRTGNSNRLIFDAAGSATFTGNVTINGLTAVTLDAAGPTTVCRNGDGRLATCGSSQRYKSNINPFSSGLSLISRLRPVSFNWLDGGMLDLGLVAEDVAKVEPLLTTTNSKGEVEGVKYDRVGVVLVNAVKEQQAQIEAQAETIRKQQQQIDALMKIVCATNSTAATCKEKMQ